MNTRTHGRAACQRSAVERYWRWSAAILAAAVLSVGCSPFQVLGFLLVPDRLVDPECPLARGKDKETRIAIVVMYEDPLGPNQVARADRDLMERLTRELKKRFEDQGYKKTTLVPTHKVVSELNRTADLQLLTGQKLGEKLNADIVVKMEIHSLTLNDKVNISSMYRGRAEIYIQVTEVEKDGPGNVVREKEYDCQYPKDRFYDANDMSLTQFKGKFLDRMVRELSQCFAPYEPRDDYISD